MSCKAFKGKGLLLEGVEKMLVLICQDGVVVLELNLDTEDSDSNACSAMRFPG